MSKQAELYTRLVDGKLLSATDSQIATSLGVCDRQVRRYLLALRKARLISISVLKYPLVTGWVNKREIKVK